MRTSNEYSLKRIAGRRLQWLQPQGRDSDVVINTRISLARNLEGYKFPLSAGAEDLEDVLNMIADTAADSIARTNGDFYDLRRLTNAARSVLIERRIISPELARAERPAGAVALRGEESSIMINGDDHLLFQSVVSGMEIDDVWKKMGRLYRGLSSSFNYAQSDKMGFLTSSPTNVGTGLRVSFTCHLTGLVLTKRLDKVLESIFPAGIDIQGLFEHGGSSISNIFRISNQATLGLTEDEITRRAASVMENVLQAEREARSKIQAENYLVAQDYVLRTFAILTSARLLGADESFGFLAALRFGLNMGWISGLSLYEINKLMLRAQPGHLAALMTGEPSDIEKDKFRADFIRQELKNARAA